MRVFYRRKSKFAKRETRNSKLELILLFRPRERSVTLSGMKVLRWITRGLARTDDQTKALQELWPILSEAHALLNTQDYDNAREVLLQAIKFRDRLHDAKTIDWILTSLGSTWLFQEKFEEQIAFFSDYVGCHPNDCAAYRDRAVALWYSGKLREAVEDYSRAIELGPTDVQSRSGRGQVLAELGENDKAVDDLDIALCCGGSTTPRRQLGRMEQAHGSVHTERPCCRGGRLGANSGSDG